MIGGVVGEGVAVTATEGAMEALVEGLVVAMEVRLRRRRV